MTDVQRYGLFVGGEFVPAHSGATFPVHNPHNDEVFAQVAEAREEDVEDAIAAARSAFEGPWGALTPKERGKLLLRLARLIQASPSPDWRQRIPVTRSATSGDSTWCGPWTGSNTSPA